MELTLISSIFILLFVALILGELMERFNLPAIIGELLTGFLLGPALLGIVSWNSVFQGLSEIALFFIILLIGVEVTTETLRRNYRLGFLFSLSGFILPFIIMSIASRYILGLGMVPSVLVSISVAVPSISVVSILLKNFSLLRLNAGHVILASVIITDIIAFGAVSTMMSPDRIYFDIAGILGVLVLIFLADYFIRRHSSLVTAAFERLHARQRGEKVIFGSIILSGLVISTILELVGVTFVLGAFFAGILISEVVIGEELHGMIVRTLTRLNDSFFIPIFFSIAGLEIIVPPMNSILQLLLLLTLSAGISAPLNYYLSRRYVRDLGERSTMGILGSRGSVGIIIASIAFGGGYIDSSLYSIAIFATLILSLAFIPLVRKSDIRGNGGAGSGESG